MGELALLVPLAPFLMVAFIVWTKHQSKLEEKRMTLGDMSQANMGRVQELEDRVRVLERIVTDKGYDVASQIEALRDARRTEALLDSREGEVTK